MDVVFLARKVTLRDNFKERCEKKLSKFSRIFSDDAKAKVTVTVNKNHQTVEVTILDNGMIYRAEASALQMNDALDKVLDMLGRQIRKHKSKLSKQIKSANIHDLIAEINENEDIADEDDDIEEDFDLVKVKNFTLKPMSVQEAILQMNMLGHTFFVFKNSENEKINVVYLRKNSTYGLIDAK